MKFSQGNEPPEACPGCGAFLQSEDPDAPGFVPKALENREGKVCRRCFRLVHYRQATKASLSDEQVFGILEREMEHADGGIVFLDALRLVPNPRLERRLREWGKPFLTVINKYDMLSAWFRDGDPTRRLETILGIPRASFLAMNALDHASVKKATAWLEKRFSAGVRILLVGPVNSGKTTFLRSVCVEARCASISPMPGTTLRPIEASSSRLGMTLVDIPGFRSDDPWIPVLCPECLVKLQPEKQLVRSAFSLAPGDALLFGGLVGVEVLSSHEGSRIGIASFTPESLEPHRTKYRRAAELIERHSGGLLKIPCRGCRMVLDGIPRTQTQVRLSKGQDLVLPGCGWISLFRGEGTFAVDAPGFFGFRIRAALIGGDDADEG